MSVLGFSAPRLRICVLGGTGFVGSELVALLAAAGHWVRVPTRVLARGKHLTVLPTVELVAADVHEPRVLGQLFANIDVVVNLIGILNERSGASFHRVHVELVEKLIEETRLARVPRVVHMSAIGADAERGASRYLRSKGQAEALLKAASSSLAVTIFRPSVIFGPGDSLTERFARLLRLGLGALPLARPRARFAPVFVEDVASALACALVVRATIGQTYELCGPQVLTLEQIVRTTAAAAQLPCHILKLPGLLGWLEGLVLGMLPGRPFSLDNFRSLGVDSLCREDGLAALRIDPRRMAGILPTYLGDLTQPRRFDRYRATVER
ncbi:MAG TPA: NAD-dependent epimerase/dehydratase family protein [Steroidobacteraceae bacterium]|nr:NAD-dependent epimerase/dehydratase family protein [Steroidobacteraceae bacterium]